MFRATLQDINLIKDSLESIASLITEGSFKISKEGIHLTAMDPASVAMVDYLILPSAFLDYAAHETYHATININNLVEILKRSRANDQITFELTENKFKITMQGDFKRSFSIPLIDTPPSSQNVPELDFKTRVEIVAAALRDGIKDAQMVSDCVVFETKPESFAIKSFGDTSETNMLLTKESASLVALDSSTEEKAKYSLDYLDKIMKGSKIADRIILRYGTDYPMRIDCTAIDKLRLSFILAPRVDTD